MHPKCYYCKRRIGEFTEVPEQWLAYYRYLDIGPQPRLERRGPGRGFQDWQLFFWPMPDDANKCFYLWPDADGLELWEERGAEDVLHGYIGKPEDLAWVFPLGR